jgi:hypothetical protein
MSFLGDCLQNFWYWRLWISVHLLLATVDAFRSGCTKQRKKLFVLKVTCCVVLCFVLLVFVLCTLCCQFLLIVYFWPPLRYSLMFVYTCQVITFYFHWSKHLRLHFYYTCKFIIYELNCNVEAHQGIGTVYPFGLILNQTVVIRF